METISRPVSTTAEKNLLQAARQLGPVIASYVEVEEKDRRLSAPVVRALREAGFYRLFAPRALGGLETDPLTAAKVLEEVARHHAAAGWSMMVSNTGAWWVSRLPQEGVDEIYQQGPDTFIAGTFHPPMKATPVEGGFLINGRNPLFSNVHEAQWISVSALVMDGERVRITDGHPVVIGVFMKREECEILDTWYTLGMRATDSNDVEARDVFVPLHRHYPFSPHFQPTRAYEGLLYQYPVMGICVACLLAPAALGVARSAIDELKALAVNKTPLASSVPLRERGVVQRKLGKAEALVESSRAYLFSQIAGAWERTLGGEKLPLDDRASLLLAAAHANQCSAKAVDLVYSAAGSSAIYTRSKLEHCFADAQVIRQHGLMNDSRYETAAQVLMGLPPDLPVVGF